MGTPPDARDSVAGNAALGDAADAQGDLERVQSKVDAARTVGTELRMTQELIANMLGVRREGVTEAALKLQNDGLIHYERGRISVLDRPGLEKRSCECYGVVKREYDRLLPSRMVT